MEVPEGYRLVEDREGGAVIRADLADIPLQMWWAQGEEFPDVPGRGGISLLKPCPGHHAVARDYRRGGALRGVLRDRFLSRHRSVRELEILMALQRAGVPTVDPLAALWRGRGLIFQLRLVTELVSGSRSLPAFLAEHPEHARSAVREAGRVIESALRCGLRHPDLHPENLLVSLDAGVPRVWMVDLDRAVLRQQPSQHASDRMLIRMVRYLERHADSLSYSGRVVDYLRFLAGMGYPRSRRRSEMRRLVPLYDRLVAQHRLMWRLSGR